MIPSPITSLATDAHAHINCSSAVFEHPGDWWNMEKSTAKESKSLSEADVEKLFHTKRSAAAVKTDIRVVSNWNVPPTGYPDSPGPCFSCYTHRLASF